MLLAENIFFYPQPFVMSNSVGDNCARNFVRNDGYVEGDPQKLATRRSTRARRENVHLRGYAH